MRRAVLLAIITILELTSLHASLQEKQVDLAMPSFMKLVLSVVNDPNIAEWHPTEKLIPVLTSIAGHIGCKILLTKDQPGDTPYRRLLLRIAQTHDCYFFPETIKGNPLVNDPDGKATTALNIFLREHLDAYYGKTLSALKPSLEEGIGPDLAATFKDALHQELTRQMLNHLQCLECLTEAPKDLTQVPSL